jgi:glycyl-tRNA synthetase beta chain
MPRFVFEIGTEEIPPRFFPPALAQLLADGRRMLEGLRLSFREVKVYGSPRRLVLIAEGLAERQASQTREERGPAARVAFDEDGKPTKAALGFARRHGVSPDDLVAKDTDQGEYVFAVVREPEMSAAEALAGALPDLTTGMVFPKTMRWGTGAVRFGRPIRWLLALVGEEVVEFEMEGLRSGRETRGHPVLADGMREVRDAAAYEETLRRQSIVVIPDERLELIYRQLEDIGRRFGAHAHRGDRDEETIEQLVQKPEEFAQTMAWNLAIETAFLVELPTAGCGEFSEGFLALPEEVLVEEMVHVQSYFPLKDSGGKLLARFVAVRDGGDEHLDTVVRGWESVLRAKLIDVRYFYEQDLKRPLADRVDDLKGVVFHEKLGTMYDKVERIRKIAAAAASQIGLTQESRANIDRAALLCKADLTTEVVAELSGLQGVMGRIYAKDGGEQGTVSDAIQEHYQPRSAGDDIPAGGVGTAIAVADKLDTLAALFAAGATPSGSTDPFGLRRAAYGLVRMQAEGPDRRGGIFPYSLSVLVQTALRALADQIDLPTPVPAVASEVIGFIRERLSVYLREQGVRYDLVEAALAVGIDDISQAAKRAEALQFAEAWDTDPQPPAAFLPTVIACTRPMNISRDVEGGEVDTDLFQDPAENALWDAYQRVASQADTVPLLQLFALFAEELRDPIDRYFDDVLVMAEDEKLRRNRLAVCWHLSQLFRRIADFSLIVQD